MPTWVEKVDALQEVPHLDQVAVLAAGDNDRSGDLLVVLSPTASGSASDMSFPYA